MSAFAGLLGVLVGALVTGVVQFRLRQSEKRERWLSELLQSCAEVYALESMFRHHVWRALKHGDRDSLSGWPLMDRRVAEAKVMLLTTDDGLVTALERVRTTGTDAYRAVRDQVDNARALMDLHRDALADFGKASQSTLRGEKVI